MADMLTADSILRTATEQAQRKQIHVATLIRWITRGARIRDGGRIHLEARRLPGRWVVSDAAIEAFIERVTAEHLGYPIAAPPTQAQRRRNAERADRELTKMGL